jgi:hypothetical protein
MSAVDKQRVAAVQTLEAMGYRFDGTQWLGPGYAFSTEADLMHGLLIDRAEALAGGAEGSPECDELAAIADVLEAYEAQRWPDGRVDGGKG